MATSEVYMATSNELPAQTTPQSAQMLDDLTAWREVVAAWHKEPQARADKLGSMVMACETPPLYLYGDY